MPAMAIKQNSEKLKNEAFVSVFLCIINHFR